MAHAVRHRLTTALLAGVAAFVGLIVAVVAVLNLHIFAGVVDGYMASPAQVIDHSVLIAIVDVLLLLVVPVLLASLVVRLRGEHTRSR